MPSTMHRKPKIWMNVTTSANWARPVVGIIRVEQEICRELRALYGPDDFGLCVFEGNEFVPYKGSSRSPKREEMRPLLWPDRSRRLCHTSTFDPVLKIARRGGDGATTKSPDSLPSEAGHDGWSSQKISYGDIIVSGGLDWDYSYVDAFHNLKKDFGVQVVTFCYDLIPIIYPQYCVGEVASKFKDYFTKLAWSSSAVMCISERSRDDFEQLVDRIGAPKVETAIIPLGDNGFNAGEDDLDNVTDAVRHLLAEPFILFVSTIERRKNHEVLYRAYHLLARAGHAARLPKLVFVGMTGWGVDDLMKDISLDPVTKDFIVQLNHVTDEELGHLYKSARFCVYPSLYEGWGLPVGEALACGKAVIASAAGSIPEVGGDLVTYLDPWNPQAWADEILKLVDHPERVQAMEEAVRKGYRPRTWHDTAKVVKNALDSLREPQDIHVELAPGYDLYTMVGTPCAGAIHSSGSAGVLTHGPYRALPAGRYDMTIVLDKLEGAAGAVRCAMRSSGGNREHGFVDVDFDKHEHFDVTLTINDIELDAQVDDYEVVIEITENVFVAINKVEINASAG